MTHFQDAARPDTYMTNCRETSSTLLEYPLILHFLHALFFRLTLNLFRKRSPVTSLQELESHGLGRKLDNGQGVGHWFGTRNSKNCFRSSFACTKFSLVWYLLTWTWPHDLPATCSMNPLDEKQPTCCVCLSQSHRMLSSRHAQNSPQMPS